MTTRFAYCGFPHVGGTFTVYRKLRGGLADHGIELRWIGTGAAAHRAWADPAWAAERAYGEVVGNPDDSEADLTSALVRRVESWADGIFINVLGSRAETNAARYLRQDVARIMIVHNVTLGTYAAATAVADYVHAVVGVSSRIRADLIVRRGLKPSRVFAIPNGVDVPGSCPIRTHGPPDSLRVIYAGRIEHAAKGVFWLPQIVKQAGPGVTLTVAGDGPDLPALRQKSTELGDRIRFLGAVPHQALPALFASHDATIAPSRFEGFNLSLVEAMAAGCVPVSARIVGVTDEIVQQDVNGFLFPVGDVAAAARALALLARSPGLLRQMSPQAWRTARDCFSSERMCETYAALIESVVAAPPAIAEPLELANWSLPRGLRSGLRTFLPAGLKNALRTWKERTVS